MEWGSTPDLSSSVSFFCSPLWVFFYLGRASATLCAVCLTVLSQAPASSSSPFVALETISRGKVQASGLSGKKTEGIATDNHITLQDSYNIKQKIQWLGLRGGASETPKWKLSHAAEVGLKMMLDSTKSCGCSMLRREVLTVTVDLLSQ